MTVKYKYLGEAEVIIRDADNYLITQDVDYSTATSYEIWAKFFDVIYRRWMTGIAKIGEPSSIIGENFFYYGYLDNSAGYPQMRDYSFTSGEGIATSYWGVERSDGTVNTFKRAIEFDTYLEQKAEAELRGVSYPPVNSYPSHNSWIVRYTHSHGTYPHIYLENARDIYINPEILHLVPVGGTRNYTLKIYRDESLVFERTETYRPEYVEIVNRECSSDTCPVLCGDTVCCYGSDGIAVNSFLLSESDYQ